MGRADSASDGARGEKKRPPGNRGAVELARPPLPYGQATGGGPPRNR